MHYATLDPQPFLSRASPMTLPRFADWLDCGVPPGPCRFRLADDEIVCECGQRYRATNGIVDLRPVQNVASNPSKYEDRNFAALFVLRQFGKSLGTTHTHPRGHSLPRIEFGAEQFYQTLSTLCLRFLDRASCILDIGCGPGRVAIDMADRGINRVLGVDISPHMISYAKMIAETERGAPIAIELYGMDSKSDTVIIQGRGLDNCEFAVGDAGSLPFKSHTFDMVVCANMLHRVQRPLDVVNECARLVRPGGFVAVSNSYDWDEQFTPKENWFYDFTAIVPATQWVLKAELDGVSYISQMSIRKYTLAFNHVQVFQFVSAVSTHHPPVSKTQTG